MRSNKQLRKIKLQNKIREQKEQLRLTLERLGFDPELSFRRTSSQNKKVKRAIIREAKEKLAPKTPNYLWYRYKK